MVSYSSLCSASVMVRWEESAFSLSSLRAACRKELQSDRNEGPCRAKGISWPSHPEMGPALGLGFWDLGCRSLEETQQSSSLGSDIAKSDLILYVDLNIRQLLDSPLHITKETSQQTDVSTTLHLLCGCLCLRSNKVLLFDPVRSGLHDMFS